uniref:NADH dehydrogenase subunit 6 n=1 Tax=Centrorhynchus clitorideus TaxID=2731796 RepID=A0A6M3YZ70_9BILA|nr:NADH dehydrogenase subunit 6 [Centrorhynchus clitorideus]
MGSLLLLGWILATGLMGGFVSGLWMATWMLILILAAAFVLWGSGMAWLIVAFVYLGGVFVLMVYVSGTDVSGSKEGSGGGLVVVGAMLILMVILGSTDGSSGFGLSVLEGGGYALVGLTAPAVLVTMVLVNWTVYGHKGTLRSL